MAYKAIAQGQDNPKLRDYMARKPAMDHPFYMEAFWELDTERPIGMAIGRIPASKIKAYADDPIFGMSDDEKFAFKLIISQIDVHYIELQRKLSETTAKASASAR